METLWTFENLVSKIYPTYIRENPWILNRISNICFQLFWKWNFSFNLNIFLIFLFQMLIINYFPLITNVVNWNVTGLVPQIITSSVVSKKIVKKINQVRFQWTYHAFYKTDFQKLSLTKHTQPNFSNTRSSFKSKCIALLRV